MKFNSGERVESNPVFMKFYTLHKSMMQRCYLETSSGYKRYGAKGVTVDPFWHDLDNFFETIEDVDGYDFDRIMKGELHLDKDTKIEGNKIYSKDNCIFIPAKDNISYKPSVMKEFVVVTPDMEIREHQWNVEKFARDNNLHPWGIHKCLTGETKTYKGWQFFYQDKFSKDDIHYQRIHVALSPERDIYTFYSIANFARTHGLSAPNITMVLKNRNNHHQKWQFFESKDFLLENILDLSPQQYKGIYNNQEYIFENMTHFAKEHDLSPSGISSAVSGKIDNHKGWKFYKI